MGIAALEHLDSALDELYALDLDALSDPELDAVTIGMARGRCRLLAVEARTVSVWDARGTWRSDGSKAAWARLGRDANLSAAEAHTIVRRARALRKMPATLEALEAGEISGGHVDLLAKANNNDVRAAAFAVEEDWLIEQSTLMRFAEWRKVIEYWCLRVDPDGCERTGRDLLDAASLTAVTTFQKSVHVNGMLDPVGGAMFREGLRRIEKDIYDTDKRNGVTRSSGARRAAALIEMAVRAHTARKDGKRPDPLVSLLAGAGPMARMCELSTGTVIPPELFAPYLDQSQVQSFVFGDAKNVLGVSKQRTFRGWLRRAIEVRDLHCQHPSGCDEPIAHCDVDHIVPDADGGETSQENGRLQCPTHNRNHTLHHRAPP